MKKEWNEIFDYYKNQENLSQSELVISILTEIQALEGYIPKEVQKALSDAAKVNAGYITAIIKSLPHLHEQSFQYEIKICISDRCKDKGATEVLKEFQRILKIRPGQVSRDKRFLLTTRYCMHHCGSGPNIEIAGKLYQNVSAADVSKIIKNLPCS